MLHPPHLIKAHCCYDRGAWSLNSFSSVWKTPAAAKWRRVSRENSAETPLKSIAPGRGPAAASTQRRYRLWLSAGLISKPSAPKGFPSSRRFSGTRSSPWAAGRPNRNYRRNLMPTGVWLIPKALRLKPSEKCAIRSNERSANCCQKPKRRHCAIPPVRTQSFSYPDCLSSAAAREAIPPEVQTTATDRSLGISSLRQES